LKESELWWRGPTWLTRPESEWPNSEVSETPQSNEERKRVNVTEASVTKRTGVTQVLDLNKFSNFGPLLRVTAWVKCFLHNLGSKGKVACSRRSDSGVRAKNKANERAGKNEGRLPLFRSLSFSLALHYLNAWNRLRERESNGEKAHWEETK